MRPLHTWPSLAPTTTARPIAFRHASSTPLLSPLGGRGRERGRKGGADETRADDDNSGREWRRSSSARLRRVAEFDATVWTRGAARIGLSFGCGAGGRHLRRMFEWNDDQQQVGDAIWAEFNESEDHIVPYPKDTEENALASVGDQKKNDEETANIPRLADRCSSGQTEFPVLEKQPGSQASEHYSAARLDIESWPDLPSLNATLDRNYSDDNIASTYLDFSSAPSLEKVTGNTTEKSNSFLDCDWGNIGDFDDFDRNGDSIFGNEMVADGSNFLSASSDLVDNTVQSIPFPHLPDKQLSSDHGSSSHLINEVLDGTTKKENKVADANAKSGDQAEHKILSECSGKPNQFSKEGDVQKKPVRSRRRTEERGKSKISNSSFSQNHGQHQPADLQSAKAPAQPLQTPQYLLHDNKNMGQLQQANQFMFPGYGYPSYQFPGIPLISNIQAESHQTKPATTNYRTSIDSPKQSSSTEKSQDVPSRPLMMTPQEKIEKLRRRQQMQALIAIQQQQQQFGQDGSGSDTMVPQAYSPKSKNPDSLGSSVVIDDNVSKVFSPELIPSSHEVIQKSSGIPDDPFIEEKIYYQLQDALGKLDTRTRRCIRDSLLRLAQSASERQITNDRSSANKTNKDEDEVSEDTSNMTRRSPAKEAETNTNPIDRIVAHLLFHRPSPKVSTPAKEEIISSTPLSTEPDISGGPSETHQNVREMTLQPSL
uniref:Protein LNK2 n=1 Tax=Leersia perrieri TaxID=77586 RepID=A0A0D9V1B1_9ORYZ